MDHSLDDQDADLEAALTAAQAGGSDASLRLAHWNLACRQKARGRLRAACASFQAALDVTSDERERAYSLLELGEIHGRLVEWEQAVAFLDRAHAILTGVDASGEGRVLRGLAREASARKDHLKARSHYDEALALAIEHGDDTAEARSRFGLAIVAWDLADLDEAEEQGSKALAVALEAGVRDVEARVLLRLGRASLKALRFTEACERIERAEQLFAEENDALGQGVCARELSEAARHTDDPASGIAHGERALALYRSVEDATALSEAAALWSIGYCAWVRGDRARPRAAFTEAASLYEQAGDDLSVAKCLEQLGMVSRDDDAPDAQVVIERALRLCEKVDYRRGLSICLKLLGDLARRDKRYAESEAHYAKALAIRGDEYADTLRATITVARADAARATGRTDEARILFLEALSDFRRIDETYDTALCLQRLGQLALSHGEAEEALGYLEEAVAAQERCGNATQALVIAVQLFDLARKAGKVESMRRWAEEAYRLSPALEDTEHRRWAHAELARIAEARGQLRPLRHHHEARLAQGLERGDAGVVGDALANLARIDADVGWSEGATEVFREALKTLELRGDEFPDELGFCRAWLGDLARRRGDYEGAKAEFEALLALGRRLPNPRAEHSALFWLGWVHGIDLHHPDEGRPFFERALTITGGTERRVDSLLGLAMIAPDNHEAELLYQRALKEAIDTGNEPGAAQALGRLARIARGRDALEVAHRLATEGAQRARDVGKKDREAECLEELICVADDRNEQDLVVAHRERLQTVRRRALPGVAWTRFGSASAAFYLDDLPRALRCAREAVAKMEAERATWSARADQQRLFFEQTRDIYYRALQIVREASLRGVPDADVAAIEIVESARSDGIARVLRAGSFEVGGDAGSILAEINELESGRLVLDRQPGTPEAGRNATASSSNDDESKRVGRREATALARLARLRNQLRDQVSPIFAKAYVPGRVPAEAIRATLSAQETHALLYDLVALEGSDPEWVGHVVWISPSGPVTVEQVHLEGLAARFIASFGQKDSELESMQRRQATATWEALGEALLPAALREVILDASEAQPLRLVIVPDRVLWQVPWAAVRVGDGALVNRSVISVTATIDLWRLLQREPESLNDTKPVKRYRRLTRRRPHEPSGTVAYLSEDLASSGIEQERAALAGLSGTLAPLTIASSRADLLRRLEQLRGLLVLAAHADSSPGLQQSLELNDAERLSAAALLTVRLPEIVSIGTCWSGFQPTREPLGLLTVCLARGARTVIGCNYAARDEAAGEILASCYALLETHRGPEALRVAQLDYVSEHPLAPPIFWATLIAFGT